jgi:hypothetical protein
MKLKSTIILIIVLAICGCGNSEKNASHKEQSETVYDSKPESKPIEIYGIKGEGIELRNGAGENFKKVVNKKATEILKKTIYVSVDYTCKVRIATEKDGWSKITVVEPDYLSTSHIGWIKTENILKSGKKEKLPMKSKLEIFNNVNGLKTELAKNGIGTLRKWRGDELGWISSSDYYSFGKESKTNSMQNNLAYYLESHQESFVEKLKIILNINNASEKKQALAEFKKTVQKTYKSIGLELPNGLLTNISNEKEFQTENENFNTKLELDKSKIDTWKLTIESQTE